MSFRKTILGDDFDCEFLGDSSNFLNINHNCGVKISFDNLICNNFTEDGALIDKFKVHSSLDNLSATAELFRTIPFGTEFLVKRSFEVADGFVRIIDDVDPGAGAIDKLELEKVTFAGDWQSITIYSLENNKVNKKTIELSNCKDEPLFQSEQAIIALSLVDTNGNAFEIGCGNDLWRHNATIENNVANFEISYNSQNISIKRNPINFPKEFALKKRAWRFKYYIAWSLKRQAINDTNSNIIDIKDLDTQKCLVASTIRRKIRDLIRKSNQSITLKADLSLCNNAKHLERNNIAELLHWGVEELFELALWGNKTLNKKGKTLNFSILENDNIFKDLIAIKAVNKNLKANINVGENE